MTRKLSRADRTMHFITITLPMLMLWILMEKSGLNFISLMAALGVATMLSIILTNIYTINRLTDMQILMETKK
ncbi:MAG: hypothetical protein COC02_05485 [Rhodospirillaceae bacterium]|nr:MAG: hypothetical protein COC02_05485 [Rhodospirillaceae bacterium]